MKSTKTPRVRRASRRPKRYLDPEDEEPAEPAPAVAASHEAGLLAIASELREQTRLWKRMVRVAEEVEAAVTEISESTKSIRDMMMEDASSSGSIEEVRVPVADAPPPPLGTHKSIEYEPQ